MCHVNVMREKYTYICLWKDKHVETEHLQSLFVKRREEKYHRFLFHCGNIRTLKPLTLEIHLVIKPLLSQTKKINIIFQ